MGPFFGRFGLPRKTQVSFFKSSAVLLHCYYCISLLYQFQKEGRTHRNPEMEHSGNFHQWETAHSELYSHQFLWNSRRVNWFNVVDQCKTHGIMSTQAQHPALIIMVLWCRRGQIPSPTGMLFYNSRRPSQRLLKIHWIRIWIVFFTLYNGRTILVDLYKRLTWLHK